MSMQQPQSDITIEELRAQRERERRQYLVGAVNPQGMVQEIVCPPDKGPGSGLEHGIDVVRLIEGNVTLTSYARNAGWTLLEDRCREDGCPQVYEAWKETVLARMDGHAIDLPVLEDGQHDMSAIYPPSVLMQRSTGGVRNIKPKRFVPGRGFVEVEEGEVSEADRKARVGKLAGQMGLEPKKGAK